VPRGVDVVLPLTRRFTWMWKRRLEEGNQLILNPVLVKGSRGIRRHDIRRHELENSQVVVRRVDTTVVEKVSKMEIDRNSRRAPYTVEEDLYTDRSRVELVGAFFPYLSCSCSPSLVVFTSCLGHSHNIGLLDEHAITPRGYHVHPEQTQLRIVPTAPVCNRRFERR
jgi:hypothetical protein